MASRLLTAVVFPTPGPPVRIKTLALSASTSGTLGSRQRQSRLLLNLSDALRGLERNPRQGAAHQALEMLGHRDFCLIQRRQKHERLPVLFAGHQAFLKDCIPYRGLHDRGRYLQQRLRLLLKGRGRHRTVAFAAEVLHHVFHTRHRAQGRVFGDIQLSGEGIGGLESDAVDIAGQTVGILLNPGDGLISVGLVDAHCSRAADAMPLKEHHDRTDHLLFLPTGEQLPLALLADAGECQQAFRFLFDDIEDRLAEGDNQLLGKVSTDALYHTGAEIFLDTDQGAGSRDLEMSGLKLQPVGSVPYPVAMSVDGLSDVEVQSGTHYRYQVSFAFDLNFQDAESCGLAMEGDALDDAGEGFCRGSGVDCQRHRFSGLSSSLSVIDS